MIKGVLAGIALATVALAETPNIVFVLADDLGYMDLVSYASRVKGVDRSECFYETPHIDRLADQSVVFSQAYACPLCSPSRSSILTGKHASRLGFMTATPGEYKTYYNQGQPAPQGCYDQDGLGNKAEHPEWPLLQGISNIALPASEVSLAKALKGYRSAFIGKWHLGGHGSVGYSPADQGFEAIAWLDSGSSPFFDWRNRWNQRKKVHPAMAQPELLSGDAGEKTGEDYLTDDLSVQACRFIERQKRENKPFFLYFCQFAVHSPFQAKKEDIAYFSKKKTRGWNGQSNPTYAAMLKSLDDGVGRLVRTLEKTGQIDNTIIVFMSDNGGIIHPDEDGTPTISNNAPFKGEKALLYEGGIRVPLFIWQPKRWEPAVCNVPVDCNDLFPTLLELAGLPLDTYLAYGDGQSLRPLLDDPENKQGAYGRNTFFWHYPFYVSVGLKHGDITPPHSAIRKGDWKLILNWEGGVELYNIKTDPSERTDCAHAQPERTKILMDAMAGWINQTVESRYVPRLNADYDPKHPEATSFQDVFSRYQLDWPLGCASRAAE